MRMPLTLVGDDAALMQALRAGHPGAAAVCYDEYAPHSHRTLPAALGEVYAVLNAMPVNERMAFVLRFVDDMSLPDVAEACGTSLATLKCRLARAEQQFLQAARDPPAIEAWLEKGARWSTQKQG